MKLRWAWPLAIIASAAAMGIAAYWNMPAPFRLAAAACFLPFGPGMAIVRFLQIQDGVAELASAIALSIAIETVVATAMVYARLWSPESALAMLLGLSAAGALMQLVRGRSPLRRSPAATVSERLAMLCKPPNRGRRDFHN